MIRRAGADDVETVVAIFEPSFATLDFLRQLHSHEENLAFFDRALAEGEAYLYGDDGFSILAGTMLSHLYVRPEAIGRGVGHALFEHAKKQRPDGFDFWVFQQNERARRFYEARGAEPVELTDGTGNEERMPDVRYVWRPAATRGSSAR
jgi:GNAT superfamily N-acetyltransferase